MIVTSIPPPQVGAERYNLLMGCPQARTATIVLRGGSEQFIDEADRSLHDAIMIVRRALKHSEVVPGGGAIEMEVRVRGNRRWEGGIMMVMLERWHMERNLLMI